MEAFQKYHVMVSDFFSKIAATLLNTESVSRTRGVEQTSSIFGE